MVNTRTWLANRSVRTKVLLVVAVLGAAAEMTASGVTEARAAAEDLARMPSELRTVVARFQLV
jgi:methyl-accepting chemotaxis protein